MSFNPRYLTMINTPNSVDTSATVNESKRTETVNPSPSRPFTHIFVNTFQKEEKSQNETTDLSSRTTHVQDSTQESKQISERIYKKK